MGIIRFSPGGVVPAADAGEGVPRGPDDRGPLPICGRGPRPQLHGDPPLQPGRHLPRHLQLHAHRVHPLHGGGPHGDAATLRGADGARGGGAPAPHQPRTGPGAASLFIVIITRSSTLDRRE
eukprot:8784900-Pyramimonas_sp.AAC.1